MKRIKAELSVSQPTLSAEVSVPQSVHVSYGIDDIRIDGESVVTNKVGEIKLGDGLDFKNGKIALSLDNASSVNPKTMSLDNQNGLSLFMQNSNGDIVKSSVNNLDYTKLKVVNREDLSLINVNDFLFIKE